MNLRRDKYRQHRAPNLSGEQQSAARALRTQTVVLDKPYHSSVYFDFVRTGAGPYTYTLAAGERRAFSYKIGDAPTLAGFRSTFSATEAETNLNQGSVTNGGEAVTVKGVRLIIEPDSDARLAALAWPNVHVTAKFQTGELSVKMGNLTMIPGGGGLYGGGVDSTGVQALGGGRPTFQHFSNGVPGFSNYYPLKTGFVWMPQSAGRDTSFELVFNVVRAVTATSADVAAAAGIAAFTSPADGSFGTYVKIKAVLVGQTRAQRSAIL